MNLKRHVHSTSNFSSKGPVFSTTGFSLIELVVILAIISVLAGLLLPAMGKAKILAQRTACLANLRQLGFSWALYASDNDGQLVESYPGESSAAPNPYAWVLGNMQLPSEAVNPQLIEKGQLFRYNNRTAVYHCPADQGRTIGKQFVRPARSYSMNAFMGDSSRFGYPALLGDASIAEHFTAGYAKESELKKPSATWVLLDEDERSISDGFFTLDPTGKQAPTRFPATSLQRHNMGFGLAFADGHAEVWRTSNPANAGSASVATSLAIRPGSAQNESPVFKKLRLSTVTAK